MQSYILPEGGDPLDLTKAVDSAVKTLILLLAGFTPMLLAALILFMSRDDTFETLAYSIALLLGGALSAWIADKFYKIPLRDFCGTLNLPIMLFVIMAAVFWSISGCFLFYGSELEGKFPRYYGNMGALSALKIFGISWLTPVGEELLYRFSIMNLIRRKRKEPIVNASAVLLTSILFMIPHLLAGTDGMLSLFLFGCIAGFILVNTNNIIYPIVFHVISNLTNMLFYNKIAAHADSNDWLWVTLPLALCFLGGMMFAASRIAPDEPDEPDEPEASAEPEPVEADEEDDEPVPREAESFAEEQPEPIRAEYSDEDQSYTHYFDGDYDDEREE